MDGTKVKTHSEIKPSLKRYVIGKVDTNGTFAYCICSGNLCNDKNVFSTKCYSTASVNEKSRTLYSISKLHDQNFFNEKNIIACPTNISQCYRYGKYWYFVSKIVLTYCEKKNVVVIKKIFCNSRLRAENFQNF